MDVFRAQDAASKEIVRRAVTEDGFDNFVSRIGLNTNNTMSASTYDFNLVTRNRVLLEAAYRGSWLTGRVIDSIAEDMTREGIDITTSDKADLKVLGKNMSRLKIWQSLGTTIKWGRLYGGSLGVMQIEGQDMSTPLDPETIALGQFKGIAVYDRWMLNPLLSPVINSGPDIGLPAMYQLVTNPNQYDPNPNPNQSNQLGGVNVHHTRCVRYTGIDLPFFQAITEMMWGESVLERMWDRLISFDNASLSSAQLIDRANLRTVGIAGLRQIIAAGGEAVEGLMKMFNMMRLLQVNEGLTLIDKDDTFATTAYSFAGLSDMLLQFGQQLAGASEIPLVRLFGQSPAGLSATGEADLRMYYDTINAQQEAKLRNPVEVLLKVMWRSTFGRSIPADLEFTFKPLWQMSAMDQATIAKTNTETVSLAFGDGLISQKTGMEELRDSSSDTGLFANITDEDINAAEEDAAPMPDDSENSGSDEEDVDGSDKPGEGKEKTDGPTPKTADSKPKWFGKK